MDNSSESTATSQSAEPDHQMASHDGRTTSGIKPASRRQLLQAIAAIGVGGPVFHRALAAQVAQNTGQQRVTDEMIQQSAWIAGLELDEQQQQSTSRGLQRIMTRVGQLRKTDVDYDVPPALLFDPAPGRPRRDIQHLRSAQPWEWSAPTASKRLPDDDLAFLPVTELSALIRGRQVSSRELTELYLKRLRELDPVLKCVVTFTDDLAYRQADQADREIAAGQYRGPLHGIPWGAKDLISVPDYPTSWGAPCFREQKLKTKATVVRRLEAAGAVLVAKLSLGALAMGDRWFGGTTRNPWNPSQGSSGSSAGSASATSAGLVAFALGSETLGSIVSPSKRCGTTGLRPTFGRVSRHGCMALSWSMDKIGPIARSAEDCALVLDAIHGSDGQDGTTVDEPFVWSRPRSLRQLRVGYFASDKDASRPELGALKELGVQLMPIKLPDKLPTWALTLILNTEAAAVFDELTRRGETEGLNSWPQTFLQHQFVSAVEYLRANRIRTLLMREMETLFKTIDVFVGEGGNNLVITNLTGHPSVVIPFGLQASGQWHSVQSLSLTGSLYGEANLLSLAREIQLATGHHLKHPQVDKLRELAKQ